MAIDEVITGNSPSATTNATNGVSEIIIEGVEGTNGRVFFQCKSSSGEWQNITSKSGVSVIFTPDTTNIEYRFLANDLVDNARVFFGP